MAKVEITPEVLRRFKRAWNAGWGSDEEPLLSDAGMMKALDFALNPPEPDPIVVTEEMIDAGWEGYPDACYMNKHALYKIYRAMRKLEPEPCEHEWAWKAENSRPHTGGCDYFLRCTKCNVWRLDKRVRVTEPLFLERRKAQRRSPNWTSAVEFSMRGLTDHRCKKRCDRRKSSDGERR
jgi:hypothetical protein